MTTENFNIMSQSFRRAMDRQEFLVVYQPKVDMQTEKCIGLEALLRWNRKDGSTVSPELFVPAAEETGDITALTFYVLEYVCQCLGEWRARGMPALPVSVNISRRDLCREDFPRRLIRCLKTYRVDSRCIELEITETAFVRDCEEIAERLGILRDYGIRIAMDDFGTGYSSLFCLKTLPIDVLKIDRIFLKDLATDKVNQSILKGILDLAQALHLEVVYEGIETKAQVDYLKRFQHKNAQGFYYAGALTKQELEYWLSKKERGFPLAANGPWKQGLFSYAE